ncbi:Solute carrier family 35 member G1 [Holothuria leucospilota]|uniref:Solute carrier family 35 member G1 n=1 Tax=Holothuria leucospilota TaxID=206669 RepID=A0A9Q0YNS7_HOLLE|nr:Solute carrier family 35 member G1 [Holothuria leucospilota]
MAGEAVNCSNCDAEEVDQNKSDLVIATTTEVTRPSSPTAERKGLIYAFLCTCFLVGQTTSIAYLAGKVNSNEIISLRYFIMGTCCIVLNIYKGVPLLPSSKQEFLYLTFRSVLGVMAVTCAFYAFHHMRAADATAIHNAGPIVTLFFSCVFLKEGFECIDAILAILTVIGVVFIAKPPFLFPTERATQEKNSELFAVFIAIAGCVFLSLTHVYLRVKRDMKVLPSKLTMYYAYISLPLSVILTSALKHWTIPSCGLDRYLVVGIGLMSFIGECLYASSLVHVSAVYVSMMLTNEVMMVFLLETFLLNVPLSWLSIVGILLIVGASLTVSIKSTFPVKHLCSTVTRSSQSEEEQP